MREVREYAGYSLKRMVARRRLLFCIVFLLVPAVCFAAGSNVGQKKRELNGVQSKIHQTKKKLQQTERSERDVLATLGKMEREIRQSKTQVEAVNRDYQDKNVEISRTQAALAGVQGELEQAKTELAARQKALNHRLRAIYMAGSGSYLELLLTSESFGDFLVRMDLVKRILRQDETLFSGIKAGKDRSSVRGFAQTGAGAGVRAESAGCFGQGQAPGTSHFGLTAAEPFPLPQRSSSAKAGL